MSKRKVLIPIDGSEKSLVSLEYLKDFYDPAKVEIILMHVKEIVFVSGIVMADEIKVAEALGQKILERAMSYLEDYDCTGEFAFGYAGDEILDYAEENNVEVIIMGKNTKKKFTTIVGSVTEHVAKKTKCILVIVPEVQE
ncbi:MAG: universal stress protein [Clostridium sp.]